MSSCPPIRRNRVGPPSSIRPAKIAPSASASRKAWKTRALARSELPYGTFDAGSGRRPPYQGSQAREWLEARRAELLEVPYFHVVFTLPSRIGAIAFQNK